MNEIQEIIVSRIKQAREESRKTQKEIALVLGYKSANAISEIERGNVNVSAKDIYILAEYFNKPILYFFGRDYKDEEITAIIESLTDSEIAEMRKLADSFVNMRRVTVEIESLVEMGEEELNAQEDLARELIEKTRAMLNEQLELMGRQMARGVKGRDQLEEILMIRPNINVPDNHDE